MSMSDKNRMFVAQSNDNEYLYQDQSGNLGRILFRYYSQKDAQNAIEMAGRTNQCHVVELVEAPAKVVVSEQEAEMLKKAKDTTVWRPLAVISAYAYEHEQQGDDEVLLEDRLMRAYVNGWTVENPKRWNIKVPHAEGYWFYLRENHKPAPVSDHAYAREFTAAEIEHYGLGDCDKVEVTDDEQ